ncbi:MAG: hypothetical protein ACOC3V_01335 [bacterium]
MPEKEEKEEGEKIYKVVEVPNSFERAIKTPEGEIMYSDQLLVKIANDLDEIKKALG